MQWTLIRLRKEAGMTQQEVAQHLGISSTAYAGKERGKYQFQADEMFLLRDLFKLSSMDDIFLPSDCINNAVDTK